MTDSNKQDGHSSETFIEFKKNSEKCKCSLCNQFFTTQSELLSHVQSDHPTVSVTIQCMLSTYIEIIEV